MFNASIGDGNLTLFWEDRWLGCDSPCLIAPELCKLAKAKVRKSRMVHDALTNKQWIHDIVGTLTVQPISEYLSLWPIMEGALLRGRGGHHQVKWTPDATYSARSAYNMFFQGSERFEGAKPIWKCHTRFTKANRIHFICALGLVYTHIINHKVNITTSASITRVLKTLLQNRIS